ncbi:MAG: DNA cytosine methyltransferase [Bacteroidetes bacterium]|nr:DNA cytosine methyltransferase [Bacteroidota bacterium]
MKLKAVSLFCGCGGLDLGFHEQGVEIVAAIDNDSAAIKCYNHNFGKGGVCLSVTDPEFKNLMIEIGKVDIVIGGFPCQGFSKSGPKKKDDPRNTLYEAMLYAIRTLNPSVFVAENVDGLAQNYKGELLSKIYKDFNSLGYKVEYKIIDAADFGVPQHRRRIIFIGSNTSDTIDWPSPTHIAKMRNGEFLSKDILKADIGLFAQNIPPAITIKEAIGDIAKNLGKIEDHVTKKIKTEDLMIINRIGIGQKLCNVRFSDTSVYTWQIPEVFGNVSEKEVIILETIAKNRRRKIYGDIPNGNPLSIEVISQLSNLQITRTEIKALIDKKYIKEIEGKFDITGAMFNSGLYKRPLWDEPSPTIITVFHSPRFMLHPSENRPLTIRECARLQSFPDNFHFLKSGISIEDSYRLIGNAVAPKLALQLAEKVLTLINKKIKNETSNFNKRQSYLVEGI